MKKKTPFHTRVLAGLLALAALLCVAPATAKEAIIGNNSTIATGPANISTAAPVTGAVSVSIEHVALSSLDDCIVQCASPTFAQSDQTAITQGVSAKNTDPATIASIAGYGTYASIVTNSKAFEQASTAQHGNSGALCLSQSGTNTAKDNGYDAVKTSNDLTVNAKNGENLAASEVAATGLLS